jgi:hypothetical protein
LTNKSYINNFEVRTKEIILSTINGEILSFLFLMKLLYHIYIHMIDLITFNKQSSLGFPTDLINSKPRKVTKQTISLINHIPFHMTPFYLYKYLSTCQLQNHPRNYIHHYHGFLQHLLPFHVNFSCLNAFIQHRHGPCGSQPRCGTTTNFSRPDHAENRPPPQRSYTNS